MSVLLLKDKEFFIHSKEVKKSTKELKEELREQGIQLRIENARMSHKREKRIMLEVTKGDKRQCCYIRHRDEVFVQIEFLGSMTLVQPNRFIQYACELAQGVRACVLFVVIKDPSIQVSYVGIRALPFSNQGNKRRFSVFESLGGHLYYINLTENYIETILEGTKTLKEGLNAIVKEDITFRYTISEYLNYTTINYYYKGLQSQLKVEFNKEILLSEEDIRMFKHVKYTSDILNLIKKFKEEIQEATKFSSLVHLPDRHFKEVFSSHLYSYRDMANEVFKLMCKEWYPKKVEEEFAKHQSNLYKDYGEKLRIKLFSFSTFYFLLNDNQKQVTLYKEFTPAYQAYKKTVLATLKDNYIKEVQSFEEIADDMYKKTIEQEN
ncbi:hypothetical protein U8V72_20080 [Priestia filamentosa]|uniref:hypothetical protein n=1 Tax=Priestia filamentosa TaxID=1402861 RepID=UPI00397A350A